jgi:hypothetical protein
MAAERQADDPIARRAASEVQERHPWTHKSAFRPKADLAIES